MVWTSRKMLRRIVSLFGLALEPDELHVDNVEMLAGFGQKLAQQIVHLDSNPTLRNANGLRGEFRPDGFMIG